PAPSEGRTKESVAPNNRPERARTPAGRRRIERNECKGSRGRARRDIDKRRGIGQDPRASMPVEYRELWPLAPGADAKIEGLLARKAATEPEARALEHLGRHGYVILPGAVDEALADALVTDVAGIAKHPGHFVTTDHRRGRRERFSDTD